MAHHVFNRPDEGLEIYRMEQHSTATACRDLGIDAGEITYVENLGGGGNAGAAVEVIVEGRIKDARVHGYEEHLEGDVELKGDRYRNAASNH